MTNFNTSFFLNHHKSNEESIFHKSRNKEKQESLVPKATKGYEDYDLEKIIIVYKYGECSQLTNDGIKKVESENSLISNKTILLWNQRSRDEAFRQFEWRVRKLYEEYVSMKGVRNNIRSFNINSVKNFRSLIVKKDGHVPFPPLRSKYYKTINIEVVQVPTFMTAKEMINITNSIPCVFNAIKDYEKKIFYNTARNKTIEKLNDITFMNSMEPILIEKNKRERDEKTTTITTYTNQTKQVNQNITKNIKHNNATEENAYRDLSILRRSFVKNLFNLFKPKESTLVPNDPLFSSQWYLLSSNKYGIDAQRGWNMLHRE
jgi:hypothetical protein